MFLQPCHRRFLVWNFHHLDSTRTKKAVKLLMDIFAIADDDLIVTKYLIPIAARALKTSVSISFCISGVKAPRAFAASITHARPS
jgi:hypothetical protein